MNDVGVNKELEFLSSVIALLDNAIDFVGDAADCMQSPKLQEAASDIELAIELLVTRELELERVSEVLNNIDYQDNEVNKSIFLSEDKIDLQCIHKNNASEVEAP